MMTIVLQPAPTCSAALTMIAMAPKKIMLKMQKPLTCIDTVESDNFVTKIIKSILVTIRDNTHSSM